MVEHNNPSFPDDELTSRINGILARGMIGPEDAAANVADDGPMFVFRAPSALRSLMQQAGVVVAEHGSAEACTFLAVCHDALAVLEAAYPGDQLNFDQISAYAEELLGVDVAATALSSVMVGDAHPGPGAADRALVEAQFTVWSAFDEVADVADGAA